MPDMTTIRLFAAALLAVTALSACSQQEVTVTRNGTTVTPPPALPETVPDVDPCTAISTDTLEAIGASDVSSGALLSEPGCSWAGINSYVTPDITLWVEGYKEPGVIEDTTIVAGTEVEIWTMSEQGGRYIARFDDLTLSVNYLPGRSEVPVDEALDLLMADVLRAYGRAEQ